MKNEIPCEVIRDLLPSYIDALTSDVTNDMVRKHLEGCEDCKKIFHRMKGTGMDGERLENAKEENRKEIDFLKKTRRNTKHKILFSGIFALFCIFAVFVMLARSYLIGENADNPFGNNLEISEIQVHGKELSVSGKISDQNLVIKNVSFSEKKGIVLLSFSGVKKGIYRTSEFQETYQAEKEIKEVRMGGQILWADGKRISPLVSRLFQAKNPYVGDMPKNGKIAEILDMQNTLGGFTNELSTQKEPFGWTMHLKKAILSETGWETCKIYAYILLAMVDNLSEVSFMLSDEEDTRHTYSVQDASEYAGENIKEMAADIGKLQDFIRYTEIAAVIAPGDKILMYVDKLKTGTYEYQMEDTPAGFSISLRPDGTFTYCESLFSSYIGEGTFTVDGDILRLRERNGASQYFLIEEKGLSFIEKGSKNFKYVPLKTGAMFTLRTNI